MRQPLTRCELEGFLRGAYELGAEIRLPWLTNMWLRIYAVPLTAIELRRRRRANLPAWYYDPLWIGLVFLALAVGLCGVWSFL